jgi:hypothetical protein
VRLRQPVAEHPNEVALRLMLLVAVVTAITRSPELVWMIRLHPNHRNSETREQIENELRHRGCNNFFIDEPTQVRLFTALSVCAHHVTPFSTSGREASVFGLSTTICHPIGGTIFHDADGGVADCGIHHTGSTAIASDSARSPY